MPGASFLSRNNDLLLVGGVLSILLILFSPIPPVLLDLFIIINFAFGLTILLLTFYVGKPVEFSTFPSLLLVATLYRLSLNVAATRLILTGADAGEVIGAIGAFAVQGNFVIGLVVFFILVVVQYVVVTSGAQRVSEVAARFVLDSVPGQQMSIDADLNMGLIDQAEAKARRKGLEKEAAFYGAMDGASKFVKGDAVAGIIILLINIIAGWIVGVTQMGMEWGQALQTFTLLTIGDGIVTQVPALIVSVATGIIVTRSSADRQLSTEIGRQLGSVPKIPLIVVVALAVLLLLPGMPKWPMAILALLAAAVFVSARRRAAATDAASEMEDQDGDAEAASMAPVRPVEILFGPSLAEHWQGMRSLLGDRIEALRQERFQHIGFHLPAVTVRDGSRLGTSDYEILLFGARHGQGTLHPDRVLAIRGGDGDRPLQDAIPARDPAFGLPALWIRETSADEARGKGYTIVDPVTVLMTHLGELLRREGPLLLMRSEVVRIVDGVRDRQPGLVEELVPALMAISDVQRILQNLVSEEVSIRDIDRIMEVLVDVGRSTKDPVELTELVRQRISHSICHELRGQHDALSVLSLDPRIENQITGSLRKAESSSGFLIDPKLAEQLIRKVSTMADAMIQQNLKPVLLCGAELRHHLKTFTRRTVPKLAIVSVREIPSNMDIKSFGIVSMD